MEIDGNSVLIGCDVSGKVRPAGFKTERGEELFSVTKRWRSLNGETPTEDADGDEKNRRK